MSFTQLSLAQTNTPRKSVSPDSSSVKNARPTDESGAKIALGLLKSKNLKRSDSVYLIVEEGQVHKKLASARTLLIQFRQASWDQQAFEAGIQDRKAFEEELIEQRAYYNQQIAEVNQQMPPVEMARTNEAVNLARNALIDQNNKLVGLANEVNDRLRLLNNQGDELRLKQKVAEEVARRREAYMQTILDTRELVDVALKSYDTLSKDPEIQQAIKAANETSKPKIKLGPSREFLSDIAAFEKLEADVLTATVELRREAGVNWIDVTINGKLTKPMIFDTGAGYTLLSSKLADEIGLKPKASDPTVECKTADGAIIKARKMTVDTMRVGKFTVRNVVCAIMPADKGDVDPLLGQSFQRHFTFQYSPEAGRLTLSQVDEGAPPKKTPRLGGKSGKSKGKRSGRSPAFGNLDSSLDGSP